MSRKIILMEKEKQTKLSKFLSYILRHHPDEIGLKLDKNGWANINELIEKSKQRIEFNHEDLSEVVKNCDKQRFKISDDGLMIRSNQGHSIENIDLQFKEIIPPDFLFHGTAPRFLESITKEGLKKMNRHHVHLYSRENIQKAKETGQRHEKGAKSIILAINAKQMYKDGFEFYLSENDVYLTDHVPVEYIRFGKTNKSRKIIKKKKIAGKLVNVIDLEACCWLGNPPKGQYKEIIEIGIACVDYYTKEIVHSRIIIVKPEFSNISKFCTKLTTLTPEYIEKNGISFKEACDVLKYEFNSEKRMWFSWGNYDREAFIKECKLKKVDYPFGKTHINLKELFGLKYGIKQAPGLSDALKVLGIEFEGQRHRGIADSINTAVILQKFLK